MMFKRIWGEDAGRLTVSAVLAALFAMGLAIAIPGARGAEVKTLLNVSYDPTRELYQAVEGQDRRGSQDQPVPWRFGQAGPVGDRRAGGRRGDPGAGL